MREIRFRAWDSANAKMLDWDTIKNHLIMPGHSGWEWLQYTGLVDRSGKEIYEGDIVKFKYNRKARTGEVAFGTCGFWVIGWLNLLNRHERYEVEVIGDIYSTPELLKVKP